MRQYSSLVEVLRQQAALRPDKLAVQMYADKPGETRALTFSQLYLQAADLGFRLASRTCPGDRVALIFPSSPEFVVAFFACLMSGLVAVPMMMPRRNSRNGASAAIITDCSPRLVLSLTALDVFPQDFRDLLENEKIGHMPIALVDNPTENLLTERGPMDPAFLQYTSGSTSTPKGVMVSHANLLDNLQMIRDRLGNHAGSSHVGWIPLYHDLGLIMNLLQPIYLGANCVLIAPSSFMHRPLNWLKAIHEHRAEVALAPNFAFDLCADRFQPHQMEGIDLSCWKIALNGAEPVRAETIERFCDIFRPYGFAPEAMRPGYGLAEATLLVSCGRRGAPTRMMSVSTAALGHGRIAPPVDSRDTARLVSCGSPVVDLSIAIVDPNNHRPVADDAIGEIWVRGPSVAGGYYQRPEESEGTFTAYLQTNGTPDDTGGWLRTGDLGFLDQEGELFVTGRIKDVMIIRGINHYPQDIEAIVGACHPAIRRDHCAAFAIRDDNGTEQIVVVQEVERTHRHSFSEAELVAAIQSAVVTEKDIALHKIVLIRPGALPKTTSGKVQRDLARRRWLAGELEPA